MIQQTDVDETLLMPADFFIPDEDYNNAVNGTTPVSGAKPAPADAVHAAPAAPTPAITQDKMQEVLEKMLILGSDSHTRLGVSKRISSYQIQ
jgi:hypothetical protein